MSDPLATDPMSHTPGPWWVERRLGDALQVNGKHRGEGSSYCVASINHWEGDADRANARLIAAAPALLSAAKEALASVTLGGCSQSARSMLADAIDKAEGRL